MASRKLKRDPEERGGNKKMGKHHKAATGMWQLNGGRNQNW